jgi:hypothetical protein
VLPIIALILKSLNASSGRVGPIRLGVPKFSRGVQIRRVDERVHELMNFELGLESIIYLNAAMG